MNLVVDIGNTAIKIGWFDGNQLIEKQHIVKADDLKHLINVRKPRNVIASSTSKEIFDEKYWIGINPIVLDASIKFPFIIDYKTPETLGSDRLAAVAGAQFLYPEENVLIIDMGTCITYDFITDDKKYLGGAISPGVKMRYKAMNSFTARLPQLDIPDIFPELLGKSTKECMDSGVMNGILNEIKGLASEYIKKFGKIKIILTGGDAHLFEKEYKEGIFAAPELVLIGLNVILQCNAENF